MYMGVLDNWMAESIWGQCYRTCIMGRLSHLLNISNHSMTYYSIFILDFATRPFCAQQHREGLHISHKATLICANRLPLQIGCLFTHADYLDPNITKYIYTHIYHLDHQRTYSFVY